MPGPTLTRRSTPTLTRSLQASPVVCNTTQCTRFELQPKPSHAPSRLGHQAIGIAGRPCNWKWVRALRFPARLSHNPRTAGLAEGSAGSSEPLEPISFAKQYHSSLFRGARLTVPLRPRIDRRLSLPSCRYNCMQIARDFSPELKAPCLVCTRRAVQLLSPNEDKEQVVFSFELCPHAPGISEGIVWSSQGSGGRGCKKKKKIPV